MLNKARSAALLGAAAMLFLAAGSPLPAEITEKNLRFVDYPDFPDAHSTWGSIGYSRKHQKVFIAVTNHRDKVGLFEYDVKTGKIRLCGFLPELANLREYQWQGKVHSEIAEGPDGNMYFSTDGGESREEYLMNHPQGYSGGFFFRWEPDLERLTVIGRGLQYESIKDITLDRINGLIMGISYPQVHLLLYDYRKNDLRDLGRVGSDHVPRVLWSDWWGNMYYVDWRQRMIKHEHETGKLLFCSDSLPAFDGTPGGRIITGVTSYAEDLANGIIYLVTYGAKVLAFHPSKLGFGKLDELGCIFGSPNRPPYNYYCPNLALGDNGMLYYFIGGHGSYVEGREQNVMMEFDPHNGQKRVVWSFPQKTVNEVTGAGVKDEFGNIYFCGRKSDPDAEAMGESGASRPFLLIFNPGKELQ
ncbi:MAG: hypothetical protein JXQ83_13700 [Candidatus Glassbacteria bacterium]|nr:hypothetical protein [Candidatus Glassbacteria bacterium]